MFKSRGEASTSLRGVLSPLSFEITLQDVPNRAVHRWRGGPAQRAFLGRFQSAADMLSTVDAVNQCGQALPGEVIAAALECWRQIREKAQARCAELVLPFLAWIAHQVMALIVPRHLRTWMVDETCCPIPGT